VDIVLRYCRGRSGGVAVDVGTGSGAIAIALAKEGRFDRVVATDISADAIAVATANAGKCGASIEFHLGDLLMAYEARSAKDAISRPKIDAVVSNLPYISYAESRDLPASVRDWEPAVALFSGDNGLALTRRLAQQAAQRLAPGGLLALEVDARRASLVAELVGADQRYADVRVQLDLAGRERFVLATRRES
jgi:release factor glutamine methyltransferase